MKRNIVLTGMEIIYKWETGHVMKQCSPDGRKLKGKIRKHIGGFFVALGATILFGKRGWRQTPNNVIN